MNSDESSPEAPAIPLPKLKAPKLVVPQLRSATTPVNIKREATHENPKVVIPVDIFEEPISVQKISQAVKAASPEPTPEPLIPKEEILSSEERPASVRDTTQITINGNPVNVADIPQIQMPSSPEEIIVPAPPDTTVMKTVPPPQPPRIKVTPRNDTQKVKFAPPPQVKKEAVPPPKSVEVVRSELQKLPVLNIPDYSSMPLEEQAQHRANFVTRFGILKTAWPSYDLPQITNEMSLAEIHAQYDMYVRHIHISKDVDQFKVYLVIMWLLIELVGIKLNFPIGGYTMSQMKAMNKYQRLLIELGETNYQSSAQAAQKSNWPVELRIVFLALTQAVVFIVVKMLAGFLGEGGANMIIEAVGSFFSGETPQPGQVLFGGPQAGPGPLPTVGGNKGLDVASLIGDLGSMFLKNQGGKGQAASQAAPATKEKRPVYTE